MKLLRRVDAASRSTWHRSAAWFTTSVALAALLCAETAGGQALGLTITNVTRQGSPREAESSTPLTAMTPIGLRDCPCETWTFFGSISGQAAFSNPRLEYWIGTDAMSCLARTNRATSGTTTPSCWEIPEDAVPPVQPVGGNSSFTVTVPAVLLVNPTARSCAAPMAQLQSSTTLYFFAMIRNSPDDDTNPPAVAYPVSYNIVGPMAPTNVSATAQDTSAQIQWNSSTPITTDDSSTSSATTTATVGLTFFHILCFPGPPIGYDAGASDAGACDINIGDAQLLDASDTAFETGVDVATDGTLVDIVPTDANVDAIGDTVLVDLLAGDAQFTCGTLPQFPITLDPNNDVQRLQYECSPPVTSMASSTVVTGLVNGAAYRFAVVAEDSAGNMSALASTNCVTPVPVTDFWQHYRNSGGQGQPGFCAVRPGPVSMRAAVPFAIAAGIAVLRRRQRRAARRATRRDR